MTPVKKQFLIMDIAPSVIKMAHLFHMILTCINASVIVLTLKVKSFLGSQDHLQKTYNTSEDKYLIMTSRNLLTWGKFTDTTSKFYSQY